VGIFIKLAIHILNDYTALIHEMEKELIKAIEKMENRLQVKDRPTGALSNVRSLLDKADEWPTSLKRASQIHFLNSWFPRVKIVCERG
jgi:hypothetical protein